MVRVRGGVDVAVPLGGADRTPTAGSMPRRPVRPRAAAAMSSIRVPAKPPAQNRSRACSRTCRSSKLRRGPRRRTVRRWPRAQFPDRGFETGEVPAGHEDPCALPGEAVGRGVVADAVRGDHTEENVDLTLAVNVKGPLFTVQKALPLLAQDASVVVVGSSNSARPNAELEIYSASKAALSNLVHNWARRSGERRFRVNVLGPGPTRTPALLRVAGEDADRFAEAVVPLGRLADPEEIAEAALFLASRASSFVTGAELFADGGYTRA